MNIYSIVFAVLLVTIGTGLAIAGSEDSRSFTPDSVKKWLSEQDTTSPASMDLDERERLIMLVSMAANFREAASSDLGLAVQKFASDNSDFHLYLESDASKSLPQTWPYVFAGSVVFAGNVNSNSPIVVYYNPYLDAAVLTQWTLMTGDSASAFRLQKMIAFVPSVFTSGAESTQVVPSWLTGESRGTPISLRDQYSRFADWFGKRWPLVASANPASLPKTYDEAVAAGVIEKRSAQALVTMMALLHKSDLAGVRESLTALRKALASGDAKDLADVIVHTDVSKPAAIAALPEHFRRDVVPVYVQAAESHCVVYLQVRLSPRFFYAVDFSGENPPKVLSAVFLDFEAAKENP